MKYVIVLSCDEASDEELDQRSSWRVQREREREKRKKGVGERQRRGG